MKRTAPLLTLCFLALAIIGCYSTKVFVKNQARLHDIHKVAVLPFVCGTKETGLLISEALSAQLITSRYTIIERTQFEKLLAEQQIALSGLLEENVSIMGKIKGIDAIIVGSATVDRGYTGLAHGGYKNYVTTATARMIDIVSGEVLVAANYSTTSAMAFGGIPSASEVGVKLAKKIASY